MRESDTSVLWVLARLALISLCSLAVIAVPALTLHQLFGSRIVWAISLGAVVLVPFVILFYRQASLIPRLAEAAAQTALQFSSGVWMLLTIGVGLLLRLGWALALPVNPQSDMATYINLAFRLLENGTMQAGGYLAYWPPGYALYLAAWFKVFPHVPTAILLINCTQFIVTTLIIYRVARRTASDGMARISALAFALWPTLWMGAAIAQKEQLLILILLGALALFCRADDCPTNRRLPMTAAAGVLLGFASLIQPSLILFVTALGAGVMISGGQRKWQRLGRVLFVVAFAMATIAPWTLRNYQVFGQVVPVSTNGGSGFYRANNPLATGEYTKRGEVDLSGLGELEANRAGYELGKAWIASNPADFAGLAVKKVVLFLGDDSSGAYETLSRDGTKSTSIYYAIKAFSNGFWLSFWLLLLAAAFSCRAAIFKELQVSCSLMAVWYMLTVHAVFESSSKYHLPLLGILCVLAASIHVDAIRRRVLRSTPREDTGDIAKEPVVNTLPDAPERHG